MNKPFLNNLKIQEIVTQPLWIIQARTLKRMIIVPFFVLLICQLFAQSQRIKFSTINQAGFLSGSKGEAFTIQTINGINKGKWFTGAGTGLDFYNERTVPLFFDVRSDLNRRKNTPFAYADAGVNFAWLNSVQKQEKSFPKTYPGLYYDFGIGWKLAGKNNNRGFILSAGYNFKQVKEKIKYLLWEPVSQSAIETFERYNYQYKRVVIKIGFML